MEEVGHLPDWNLNLGLDTRLWVWGVDNYTEADIRMLNKQGGEETSHILSLELIESEKNRCVEEKRIYKIWQQVAEDMRTFIDYQQNWYEKEKKEEVASPPDRWLDYFLKHRSSSELKKIFHKICVTDRHNRLKEIDPRLVGEKILFLHWYNYFVDIFRWIGHMMKRCVYREEVGKLQRALELCKCIEWRESTINALGEEIYV